jgi:hypothetical protein
VSKWWVDAQSIIKRSDVGHINIQFATQGQHVVTLSFDNQGTLLIKESCTSNYAVFWTGDPILFPGRKLRLTMTKGHAMAIEDSVTLSLCFARCKDASSIPRALHAFEAIRKPRTTLLGKYAEHNAHIWQLPDGPEQRERDTRLRKTPFFIAPDFNGRHVDEVPGITPDPLFFPYMLAHDVVAFVSAELRRSG